MHEPKYDSFFFTWSRARMEDFLLFEEKDREQETLQNLLVLEKNEPLVPVTPHISHTAEDAGTDTEHTRS